MHACAYLRTRAHAHSQTLTRARARTFTRIAKTHKNAHEHAHAYISALTQTQIYIEAIHAKHENTLAYVTCLCINLTDCKPLEKFEERSFDDPCVISLENRRCRDLA